MMSKGKLKSFSEIKLLSLDVDGVLTDGGLYYTDDGDEIRKFNVKDGMGIKKIQEVGVQIAIISAGSSPSILHRANHLGIDHVFIRCNEKLPKIIRLCDELQIDLSQVGHVGDDVNDLPIMQAVGYPMTIADAMDSVIEVAHYVSKRKGGEGAVREICDLIVAAKG